MLRLPQFTYAAPKTLDEACAMLADRGEATRILAGGTDVVPALKNRLLQPSYVMDLRSTAGLQGIRREGDTLHIGPLTSLSAIEKHALVIDRLPALSHAANLVAAKQLRNMGTIGGNIALQPRCTYYNQPDVWIGTLGPCLKRGGETCHAVKGSPECRAYLAADTVPVLVSLHAAITITSQEGERRCALAEFYTGDGQRPHNLKSTEIISAVSIPLPRRSGDEARAGVYRKLRLRKAIDFPLVGTAVNLAGKNGCCTDIDVVLGAVDSKPVVVDEIGHLLQDRIITDELVEEAGTLARKAARPVANAATSPGYRRDMAAELTKRCLKEAAQKAGIT
jgi:4-hydroxybenzoyl-CoA reductase subunit beta